MLLSNRFATAKTIVMFLLSAVSRARAYLKPPPGVDVPWDDVLLPEIHFSEDRTEYSWNYYRTSPDHLDRQWARITRHEMFPSAVLSKGDAPPTRMVSMTPSFDAEIESIPIKAPSKDWLPGQPLDLFGKTLLEALEYASTDAFMIIKDNKIVYEKYFLNCESTSHHDIYSMTKSYTALMAVDLIHKGEMKEDDLVSTHVPKLSNLEGVTIRHLLDMTAAVQYTEYADECDQWTKFYKEIRESIAANNTQVGINLPIPQECSITARFASMRPFYSWNEFYYNMGNKDYTRWPGPQSLRDFLMSLKLDATDPEHGKTFQYKTAVTDTLGLVVDEVLRKREEKTYYRAPSAEYFEKNFWSKIGAQSDAFVRVDGQRFPEWGGGVAATLRDVAKFGQVLLNDGKADDGTQVIEREILDDIKRGGLTPENQEQFARSGFGFQIYNGFVNASEYQYDNSKFIKEDYLKAIGEPNGVQKGFAYRNKFYVLPDHVVAQIGIHGQKVWVDYDANMVVAKLASAQFATNTDAHDWAMFYDISTYFQEKFEFPRSPPTKSPKKGKKGKKSPKARV